MLPALVCEELQGAYQESYRDNRTRKCTLAKVFRRANKEHYVTTPSWTIVWLSELQQDSICQVVWCWSASHLSLSFPCGHNRVLRVIFWGSI